MFACAAAEFLARLSVGLGLGGISSIMKDLSEPLQVIITGASGLLGRAVLQELNECDGGNFKVVGLSHTRSGPSLLQADLTDPVERLKVRTP